jgi:hypothetical protein
MDVLLCAALRQPQRWMQRCLPDTAATVPHTTRSAQR